MFDAMMRLVEQQQIDGAIRRPEFDPPPSTETSLDDEARAALIAFIDRSTPDRHKVALADGRTAVVFFDQRARATTAVLDDLDDDTLNWIAQSKNLRGDPVPKSDPGYPQPAEEERQFREDAGFTLTPKSRTAMEKFIYARFPNDQKMKSGGRMKVLFSGNAAKAAGVQSNAVLYLDAMECSAVAAVAQLLGYKGSIEKMQEQQPVLATSRDELAEREEFSPVRRSRDYMDPTIEIYTVSKDDMDEVAFAKWLRQRGIRGKIQKAGNGFQVIVAEERQLGEATDARIGKFFNLKSMSQNVWFYPLEAQKNGGYRGLQVYRKDNGRPSNAAMKSQPGRDFSDGAWKEATPEDDVLAKFKDNPAFK